MFSKEERDALAKTLQDTILQNVPTALEKTNSEGAIAYRISAQSKLEAFCLLLIHRDHLELRFPDCPNVAASDSHFKAVDGTDSCRLIVRKRTDIPGEVLNAALRAAAGIT